MAPLCENAGGSAGESHPGSATMRRTASLQACPYCPGTYRSGVGQGTRPGSMRLRLSLVRVTAERVARLHPDLMASGMLHSGYAACGRGLRGQCELSVSAVYSWCHGSVDDAGLMMWRFLRPAVVPRLATSSLRAPIWCAAGKAAGDSTPRLFYPSQGSVCVAYGGAVRLDFKALSLVVGWEGVRCELAVSAGSE